MRIPSRTVEPRVDAAVHSTRPVRLRIGGALYTMSADEAIDLARRLVAAVDELKGGVR